MKHESCMFVVITLFVMVLKLEKGEFKLKGYDGPILECDRCEAEMELKSGRFGKYFDCTNSECKNTRKLLASGEAAPPKEDPVQLPELSCEKSEAHFVLRDGAAGIFLSGEYLSLDHVKHVHLK